MSGWFTIEPICDDTYAISEYGHWEETHCYLLLGASRALLIDTGLGIGNIREEVDRLTDLPVRVVTTHVHWDHIGGHWLFRDISVHAGDAGWLRDGIPLPLDAVKRSILQEPLRKTPPSGFDIGRYRVFTGEPATILADGDVIDLGSRAVRVLHTPGHSPGHICLWEEDRGFLYTGDLLYRGTLYAFYPSTSPLDFRQSVRRVGGLRGIRRLLPGHHDPDIPVDLVARVGQAFDEIAKSHGLTHGGGLFEFGDFSIQI